MIKINYYSKKDMVFVIRPSFLKSNLLALCVFLSCIMIIDSYDCKIGCELDISVNGNIVCGEDYNDYPNECFALCQLKKGIAVIRTGSCATNDANNDISSVAKEASNTRNVNISSIITTGLIPINVMKQYQNDGFNFVHHWDYKKLNGKVRKPSITIDPNSNIITESSSLQQKQQQPQHFSYRPSMITSEGYEYIGKEIEYNEISTLLPGRLPRSVDAYDPHSSSTATNNDLYNRLLKVIGTDTRIQIMNTTKTPFSFVGALGYSPDRIICSGTVIYKSAVLTAAHCVFDMSRQQWINHTYFAPGRGNNGIWFNDPYGRWDVDKIMIFNSFKSYWRTQYGLDVAVITYKPNNNSQLIGDVVGYAGLEEVTGYDDPNLDQSSITGYPFDKGGRTMWTTGRCPNGFVSGRKFGIGFDARVALHDCDVTDGTSGSSIMKIDNMNDNNYKVHGVNTFEIPYILPWNGGNVFFQGNGLYDSILYLSGRSTTPVSEPEPIRIFCFSRSNVVEVLGVGEISISQLKIDNYVKGKNDKFTRVYSLGHWNHNIESSFLQIYLHDEVLPLEISPKHFVFAERLEDSTTPGYDRTSHQITIPASDVIIGDILSGREVTSIHHIIRRGIYAPLTETGDIVVSQVLASNYVHLIESSWMIWNQHTLGHIVWFPNRCFCRYFMNVCMNESYTKDGYTLYASWIIRLSSTINELGWLFHLIISLVFVPIATVVWMIESMTITFYLMFGIIMIAMRNVITTKRA